MASSPPPKPQVPVQPTSATSVSAIEANKEAANTLDDSAKKPDWLAELSRKQANRRSGLFSGNSSETALDTCIAPGPAPTVTGSKPLPISGGSSPPKVAENNNIKPVVAPDKPHIPLKPSQIRDEARKSRDFLPKRNSSENLINNSNTSLNADKENNKPTILRETTQTQKPSSLMFSKTTTDHQDMVMTATNPIAKPKIIESKPVTTKSSSSSLNNSNDSSNSPPPPQQSSNVVTSPVSETGPPKKLSLNSENIVTKTSPARGGSHETENRKVSSTSPPIIEIPKVISPEVAKVTTSAVGWKPSILQSSSSVEDSAVEVEMNLEQRVKKLEMLVASMQSSYEAKFEALNKALELERKARLNAEDELHKLIKH